MSLKELLLRIPKRLSAQVLYVLAAFAFMVVFSSIFVNNMERDHLFRDAKDSLANTQAHIEADLREPESLIGSVAETIRLMILRGDGFEDVWDYFTNLSDYIIHYGEGIMGYFTGAYGAFDIFDDRFCTGIDWIPPDDYDPRSRPWYIAAVEAGGGVGVTEPYHDLAFNITSISYARQIFDTDGRPLGVVCLDVRLDRVRGYAVNAQLVKGGHGMLLDRNLRIIAHPDPDYLDKNIRDISGGLAQFADRLERDGRVEEQLYQNYNGDMSVAFFERLKNGWYIGIVTPRDEYYKSTQNLTWFLILLGSALAVVLSAVLLRIVALKSKADERMRIMYSVMPLSVTFLDRRLNVIDCNEKAVKMFGVPGKQDLLDNFYRLSPKRQPNGRPSEELAIEHMKTAFREGYFHFDWLHQRLDGEQIPCEITLIRVEQDKEPRLVAYLHDMRELQAAIAELREADERTQLMLDATPLCCCLIDMSLRVIDCNNEAVKLFEMSGKQEFSDRFIELSPEYQPNGDHSMDMIKKHGARALEHGYDRFEWNHQTLKGELIPADVTLVRVKHKGDFIIAGFIRDLRELKAMISEMRRIEIAEESNRAKSKFIATMSHEMRTPLNVILGVTELQMMDDTLPIGVQEAFSWVYNSGYTLLHIINDILNLAKIEAGKLELTPVKYEMASLLNDTAQLNLVQRGSKAIEFRLQVAEDTPAVLLGDELRIKQILSNLLSNAFKYTEKGSVTLSVSAETEEDRLDVVVILRVSDTGYGMTEEQKKTLYDEYSRFNTEADRTSEGTGLGMSITQNLVKLMNGEIAVESEPGQGTTFIVRLPQIRIGFEVLGQKMAENLQHFRMSQSARRKKTQFVREYMPYGHVLIVDDVESNAYVARGLMVPYGLSVETVMSGFDAIDQIRAGKIYDVVFMDHMMPKMDGIETTRRLRDMGYDRPIVALTANAVAGQADVFMARGFDGFLSKPIDTRLLDTTLNKLIRDKYPPEIIETARRQKQQINENAAKKIAQTMVDPELAKIFIRDADKAIAALTAIHAKNGVYNEEDIQMYIINVHAMKSALASIGQQALSAVALRLEDTVRTGDISVIMSETPLFIEKLLVIVEKITPKEDAVNAALESENMAFLREKLTAFQTACTDYNKKAAKEALSDLRQKAWTHQTNELLDNISIYLLHSAFEEAKDTAEAAIRRITEG